jgi:hypothetical protein
MFRGLKYMFQAPKFILQTLQHKLVNYDFSFISHINAFRYRLLA